MIETAKSLAFGELAARSHRRLTLNGADGAELTRRRRGSFGNVMPIRLEEFGDVWFWRREKRTRT
jgi:hypothetical protein